MCFSDLFQDLAVWWREENVLPVESVWGLAALVSSVNLQMELSARLLPVFHTKSLSLSLCYNDVHRSVRKSNETKRGGWIH